MRKRGASAAASASQSLARGQPPAKRTKCKALGELKNISNAAAVFQSCVLLARRPLLLPNPEPDPGPGRRLERFLLWMFPVAAGETNLLRVINAALDNELFFTIAGHKMTVVGADASYTKPYTTSVLMLGPGQTTDVLVTTDQPPSRYYVAARSYASAQGVSFGNTTTTAILEYDCGCSSKPGQGIPPTSRPTSRSWRPRSRSSAAQGRTPAQGLRNPPPCPPPFLSLQLFIHQKGKTGREIWRFWGVRDSFTRKLGSDAIFPLFVASSDS